MFQELKNILMSWEMPQLIERFEAFGIYSTESFKYMTDEDLNTIFRPNEMEFKMKFRYKVGLWRRANDVDENMDTAASMRQMLNKIYTAVTTQQVQPMAPVEKREAPSTPPVAAPQDYNLEQYMIQKSDRFCNYIIYEKHNPQLLSPKGRQIIINSAIEFYTSRNQFMTEREFLLVANQICAKFSEEKVESYFNKNGPQTGGRLYHGYKNTVSRLRKEGYFPSRKKQRLAQKSANFEIQPNRGPSKSPVDDDKDKEWLKCFSEPWDEIKTRWVKTAEKRGIFIRSINADSLEQILAEWPAYKHDFGKSLVDIDFNAYCKNDNALQDMWEYFCLDFQLKAPKIIKDKPSLTAIANLRDITNRDRRDSLVVDLLSALLPPTGIAKQKHTGKIWKSSIQDSQQQLLLRVKTPADLQLQINRLTSLLDDHNLTLQPMVAIIEQPGEYEYLGIYRNIIYKYSSLLEAVANVFKMHLVLNLSFQKSCQHVWEFIQRYFFKLECKRYSTRVSEIIAEFQ